MSSPGQQAYDLAFRISPIILTGGIADLLPFGMLPIIVLTESINFSFGLLSNSQVLDKSPDDYFAHFDPLPGGTVISNQVGTYPFANQTVAANAIISQPLTVSLKMICPARGEGGFARKTATMLMLQAALTKHNNNGGTYTVLTPNAFYASCIMIRMSDAGSRDKQRQVEWQMDFTQPLLTLSAAQQALNNVMQRISGGAPTFGQLSGIGAVTGLFSQPGTGIVPTSWGTNVSSLFGS